MPTHPQVSCDIAAVKADLVDSFRRAVEPLVDEAWAGTLTPGDAERRAWKALVPIGAQLLAVLFAALCRHATVRALADGGVHLFDVELRMGKDYWATLRTTFGTVRFPWFAFRGPDGRTVAPARDRLFPLRRKIRVTEVLLEWECALAADHPFRKAAEALLFFTHGAVDIEDNTLERHALLGGHSIPREWLYRTVDDIRRILIERATCDADSGRPILYASTDAHALRRFVDDSWNAAWKMSNGIRLWCIDRVTGSIIHIGGEYTWLDCEGVADIFRSLQLSGHLPVDGNYGEGVRAQIAFVTDGSEWIAQRILSQYKDAVHILDLFHVIEHVAAAARLLYPKSKTKAKRLVREAQQLLGMRDRRPRAKLRKGPRPPRPAQPPPATTGCARDLYDLLVPHLNACASPTRREKIWLVIEYTTDNASRMNYGALRARGFQIGSGAMESLHRTASQLRLKRPGCRWTPEAAQGILNLRMLQQTGRWDEYWRRPDMVASQIAQCAA